MAISLKDRGTCESMIGKTVSNVGVVFMNETHDKVVVIHFTDKTFTAIATNPDESVIKCFVERVNMESN